MIDTLRADHLGVYGYTRDTSPVLDEFAKDAVTFKRAYTQASWTRASIGSLFTGRFPSRHGAVRREHRLYPNVPVLPEILGDLGYSTAGFYSNPNLLPAFGFQRGFEVYEDIHTLGKRLDATAINQGVFEYLETAPEGPLFLYIHTMSPHAPYKAAPPFESRYHAEGQSELERMIASYDGEIAYTDHEFGKLLARLRRDGIYDDALIIVVSDHGEEFFDHGWKYHGHTLFQEQLHVPLLIRFPQGRHAGTVVDQPVRVMDVAPSILAELEAAPPAGIDGESFTGLLDSDDASYAPVLFAEQSLSKNVLVSLIEDEYKLIRRDGPEHRRGTELYNLREDAGEKTNLFAEQGKRAQAMLESLETIESKRGGGTYVELRNASQGTARHQLKGSLVAVGGRFSSWDVTGLEEDDRMELDSSATRAEFELRLSNRNSPIEGETALVLVDMVRVRFSLEPADAGFRIELSQDGQPQPGFDVALGSSNEPTRVGLPFESEGHAEALAALEERPDNRPEHSRPHVYIYSLPTSSSLEIDPALDERLRALGYVGDD